MTHRCGEPRADGEPCRARVSEEGAHCWRHGGRVKPDAKPELGTLETPAHGRGKLWRGKPKNHVPGPGRPPSRIREELRGDFDQMKHVLRDIAGGVIPFLVGRCEECEHESEITLEDIEKRIPSASDRLRALDIMAKYALGHAKGYDAELVGKLAAATAELFADQPERHPKLLEEWKLVISEHLA